MLDPEALDLRGLSDLEILDLIDTLPEPAVHSLLRAMQAEGVTMPEDPVSQARDLDEAYRIRPHLEYLSNRLAQAVIDVENGQSRYLRVSMPPRSGKSRLTSIALPLWLLRKHDDWKIGMISHSPTLAVSWGRAVRRTIEEVGPSLGLTLAKDAGAAAEWETTGGGGIVARSAPGQSITGLGFKVMLIDDVVKDFATAHSERAREAIWDWWLANASTRLEPPFLVVVIGTRWHEDDFIGRLASPEHEGDPDDWEVIELPAIADTADVLGRSPGEPLLLPLLEESREEALERWETVRRSVGTYAWTALYQQSPTSAKGTIFDADWWRYWTEDPAKATADGRVIHLDMTRPPIGQWLDSWDMAFKGTDDSDFVVGQRWLQQGDRRLLIAQTRERLTFTQSLRRMKQWSDPADPLTPPFTSHVTRRLVEDKANGTAVIDTLKDEITGLEPVNPTESKQARARAVTPEIEDGKVYLPHPGDSGNDWVIDLISELRNFPTGAHDDQVDALTQALLHMRGLRPGSIASPNRVIPRGRRSLGIGQVALTQQGRRRLG